VREERAKGRSLLKKEILNTVEERLLVGGKEGGRRPIASGSMMKKSESSPLKK